jgi:hypothetical protein
VGNSQSTGDSDDKDEYLRLCGVIAPLMSGNTRASKDWMRPIFLYALMNAFNGFLKHQHEQVTWTIENGVLTQSTNWSLVDLKQRITSARKWPGSDAQLKTHIEKLADTGFLTFDSTSKRYSVRPRLLEWLLNHASSLHQAIFNDPLPQLWKTDEKGSWLDLNEILFKYFYEITGDNWRDFRTAANKEIATHIPKSAIKKKNDYTNDYIGERPQYWVVIFTVGFLQPINQWSIADRANSLQISAYVSNPKDVANAVEQLRDYGIVTIDDTQNVRIAPKFSSRMEHVISGVEANMPKLRADCLTWKEGATKA